MAKIYFDETSLKRFVNVGLDSSINNIRRAIEISSMIYVPYDFKHRDYLKSLDDNLKSDLNTINGVYSTIKNSSKKYSDINNDIESQVRGIDNYQISLRQSAIK